jgi:hypothetical protein
MYIFVHLAITGVFFTILFQSLLITVIAAVDKSLRSLFLCCFVRTSITKTKTALNIWRSLVCIGHLILLKLCGSLFHAQVVFVSYFLVSGGKASLYCR